MPTQRGKYAKTDLKLQQLLVLLEGVKYKTIKELSQALGPQSERQTRRQLDQLMALGYEVEKQEGRSDARRIYHKQRNALPIFSFDELTELMQGISKTTISKELKEKTARLVTARIENTFPYYEVYSTIREAIQKGRKVRIKSYAAGDKPPSERTCTFGHVDLEQAKGYAWDTNRQRYYTLNLEKMKGVSLSDEKADSYTPWGEIKEDTDLFGFTPTENAFEVSLLLTALAASLLVRQFPDARTHLLEIKNKKYPYSFKATVYAIAPMARFVVGLFDQVLIEGDTDVKANILSFFNNKILNGKSLSFSK